MILSCQNITKAFQDKPILNNVSFFIEDYGKAAIVGINGAGKTTLLKIISGNLSADGGTVSIAKNKTFGFLAQEQTVDTDNTVYEEMLSVKQHLLNMQQRMRDMERRMKEVSGSRLEELMDAYAKLTHEFESGGGYACQSEVTGVLKGLGFQEEEFANPVRTLSGGQKTRVALGRLLLLKPDLIMLDEPTNHLDVASIAWLETYLSNYKGAVLLVSHDRYFLDKTIGQIIELDNAKATIFEGNYSAYARKKEMLRTAQWSAYVNQQREIRHQEEVIEKLRSFNREKSIRRAESREKMLEKMEVLDKPVFVRPEMKLHLTPKFLSGKDVLSAEGISKAFGTLSLFEGLHLSLKRGEHAALIGDNGTGKTTLLKILNGLLPADCGTVKIGAGVQIGYYDQEHQALHADKTLFDEISDACPALNNTQIRNTLAAFLFTGDDILKRIGSLSGGERGRVSLAKLMLSDANFLILDEPTNHLDMVSKEILEDALNNYEGTLLYVSHDRYFINKTASRIIELADRQLTGYLGNYDYYLEKKAQAAALSFAPAAVSQKADSAAKADWKAAKEQQAAKRRQENAIKRCEARIEGAEGQLREVESAIADPAIASDAAALTPLVARQAALLGELEKLYAEWETLSDDTP